MEERSPLSDRLRRMGESYESSISRARAEQLAARSVARVGARGGRRRSLVAALAGVTFALVGATGLGAIADRAVPGQWLYGIDRAYEDIGSVLGVTPDPVEERLDESRQLAERGDLQGAIVVVDEVLGRYTTPTSPTVVEDVPTTTSSTVAVVEPDPAAVVEDSPTPASRSVEPPALETQTIDDADPVERLILAIESFGRAVRAVRDDPAATAQLELAVAELEAAKQAVDAGTQAQAPTTTTPPPTTTKPPIDSTTSSTATTVPSTTETTSGTTSSTTSSTTTTTTLPNDEGGGDGTGDGTGSGGGGGTPPPTIIIPIEH